jgi:hypothetical protein
LPTNIVYKRLGNVFLQRAANASWKLQANENAFCKTILKENAKKLAVNDRERTPWWQAQGERQPKNPLRTTFNMELNTFPKK